MSNKTGPLQICQARPLHDILPLKMYLHISGIRQKDVGGVGVGVGVDDAFFVDVDDVYDDGDDCVDYSVDYVVDFGVVGEAYVGVSDGVVADNGVDDVRVVVVVDVVGD